ncbi:MAG: hypothetical protein KDC53_05390, partial [Saprospiraceae bacterium]|nr:hypothetical protein [Saprospiraceae bacterium]
MKKLSPHASIVTIALKALVIFLLLLSQPHLIFSQSPCNCTIRWQGGGTWNVDGTVDDRPNANDGIENIMYPGGVIRCANAAETDASITPTCTYQSGVFPIILDQLLCPNTQPPANGCSVIWLNLDVRAYAGAAEFQFKVPNNISPNLKFAVFISNVHESNVTGQALNGQHISGDCADLSLVDCGSYTPNTWETFPIPEIDLVSNVYLAFWDANCQGPASPSFSINAFKARNGCGEVAGCQLDLATAPTTACIGNSGQYEITFTVSGINGTFDLVDNTTNGIVSSTPTFPVTFGTPGHSVEITILHNGIDYDFS